MTKPMVRIHNTDTNEIIDREMTVAEFKQYQIDQEAVALEIQIASDKRAAKQAILDKLGLTVEELEIALS